MTAALPEAITSGRELDGFVIRELVQSGAMARIYRVEAAATRASIGFPAIMKVPRTGVGEGGSALLEFETESAVLPALTGSHVPRFVAAGDLGRSPYLVLEWIDGGPLEDSLRKGPLPAVEVARLGSAVADALHSIHQQGFIHFDLKPGNVIMRPSGEAVLIDFGMTHHARFPDLLSEERRFAAGSAPYIAPEPLRGNRSDPRSDVFALGVMLYEMATGELPFGAPQTLAGLGDRLWLDPLPPRARVSSIPAWLQEITLRCLEPNAERRYQSAAHLSFDLRHPDDLPLTERAHKLRRASLIGQVRRWWTMRPGRSGSVAQPTREVDARVIMVAIDTMHPDDARHPALRHATARILSLSSEFRLICVSVVRGEPIAAAAGHAGIHLEHLARLRHWVEPLQLAPGRLSLHVIESLSPTATLLKFARDNNVDLIVIGAPNPSQQALTWWRSVASGVTANAHCSVHVVRVAD
jgi:eukaryotic-like serine/threonine-protein kinase